VQKRISVLQIGWVLLVIAGLGLLWIEGVPVHEVESSRHGAIEAYDWNAISVGLFTAGMIALGGLIVLQRLGRKATKQESEEI